MNDNPFSAPSANPTGGPIATGSSAYSEGDLLVTELTAELPLVCAKCGTHDDVQHVRLKAQWVPFWVRLTILASPLVMLILWFIFRKRCDVQVGLCDKHRSQRMMGLGVGYGGLALGLVMMLGGVFVIDVVGEGALLAAFLGFVVLIGAIIALAYLAMPMRLKKIADERAYFAGAHAGLHDAVG